MSSLSRENFVELAHSPYPIWSISSLLFASSVLSPLLQTPPLIHRLGFSTIFLGSGYIIKTGDFRNGAGVTTAWSLTYLFLHARSSLRASSRSLWSVGLTISSTLVTGLYGGNYFVWQDFGRELIVEDDDYGN